MTLQEIFNKAYQGVLQQGGPSVGRDTMCRYRMTHPETGYLRCCGVGHLISSEAYDPYADDGSKTVGDDFTGQIRQMLTKSGIDCDAEGVWELLDQIQQAHDGASFGLMDEEMLTPEGDRRFLGYFAQRMQDVAQRLKLEEPKILPAGFRPGELVVIASGSGGRSMLGEVPPIPGP